MFKTYMNLFFIFLVKIYQFITTMHLQYYSATMEKNIVSNQCKTLLILSAGELIATSWLAVTDKSLDLVYPNMYDQCYGK